MQTIEEALQFIHSCNRFGGKKDSLERMRCLMHCLGDPQETFPAVHIAGTNGKGSTAAITANVLKEAGYKTGLFTSPFLIRFNERIRINGTEIPDEDLVTLTAKVKKACASVMEHGFSHPLEFEVVTALGFCYFHQEKVDIAVIEVGIGGRLDSTNILTAPLVSVITSVSFDHTAILGNTISEIALEKAGIIKNGCPVVSAPQFFSEADLVLQETAKDRNAPFYKAAGAAGTCTAAGFLYHGTCLLPLPGIHQAENLGTALCALKVLGRRGFHIPEAAVEAGIASTHWAGRCQWIGNILIDGAHNPDACRILSEYLKTYVSDRKIVLLYTAMKDKNTDACIALLAPYCDQVFTTQIMPPRGESAKVLAETFQNNGIENVAAIEDPTQAFEAARYLGTEKDMAVVVCGSLYLAGHVLTLLKNQGFAV